MTSSEIIYANLSQENPERPGLNFTGDRMDDMCMGVISPSEKYHPRRWTEGEFEYYDDEWGNIWRRMKDGCLGGEVYKPRLTNWVELDSLQFPDFNNPTRYETLRTRYAQPIDRFKMACMPGWVFASSRYLRKMEIYFMDLIQYREEIDRLHKRITDLLVDVIRLFGTCGVQAIFFAEDLGVQDRLLMSPSMWRDIFRPHYLRLTSTAHELGMKVFMHSCGYNWDLLDDLVDAGIDCFQFDQPEAYDLASLAKKFKERKVALWSPVDIQKILPTGNRTLIEDEVRKMAHLFKGCLIFKNYGDLPGIGVQDEWDQWAYKEALDVCGLS